MGPDAKDFGLPNGQSISIGPKSTLRIPIQFKSRFTRESEATIAFIGSCLGVQKGNTTTFALKSLVEKANSKVIMDFFLELKNIKCV